MRISTIAIRGLTRDKLRTALTLLGIAVAVLSFLLLRTTLNAWNDAIRQASHDRIATRNKTSLGLRIPYHYIERVRSVPGVASAMPMLTFGGKDPNSKAYFNSYAVEPQTFLSVFRDIKVSPEHLAAWKANPKSVLIGHALANKMNWHPGTEVTLESRFFSGRWTLEVAGYYDTSVRAAPKSWLILHYSNVDSALPQDLQGQATMIFSRLKDPSQAAAVGDAIDRMFANERVETLTMSERAMTVSALTQVSSLFDALDVISAVIMVVLLLILGNTIAMSVRERTAEYGTLRALGLGRGSITRLVLTEAAILGVAGALLGVAIAYPLLDRGLGNYLEQNVGEFFPRFRIGAALALQAVLLPLFLAFVAAIIPALRTTRLAVADTLRRLD